MLTWNGPRGTESRGVDSFIVPDGRIVPQIFTTPAAAAVPGSPPAMATKDGEPLTTDLPALWHPLLGRYGTNAVVPDEGSYTVSVCITAPGRTRHDPVEATGRASRCKSPSPTRDSTPTASRARTRAHADVPPALPARQVGRRWGRIADRRQQGQLTAEAVFTRESADADGYAGGSTLKCDVVT